MVESEVETACWSDSDANFLLVAEHSGKLSMLHRASWSVINAQRLLSQNMDGKSFLQVLRVESRYLDHRVILPMRR